MKALLINGARSLGTLYDFQVHERHQLPGLGPGQPDQQPPGRPRPTPAPSPTGASCCSSIRARPTRWPPATAHTRRPALDRRQRAIARCASRWSGPIRPATRPPASSWSTTWTWSSPTWTPATVYFGNDIAVGSDFNLPVGPTNCRADLDAVNNVENVFLGRPLGTNLLRHRRRPPGERERRHRADRTTWSQDYALVVSLGRWREQRPDGGPGLHPVRSAPTPPPRSSRTILPAAP